MISKWTAHLTDPQEIQLFESKVLAAKPVLERLQQMIREEEDNLETKETSIKTFDQPNWEYRTAYGFGFKGLVRILNIILDLGVKNDRNTIS